MALEKFPNEGYIKAAHKIIHYGGSELTIADRLDLEASKEFENKEYEIAIDKWLRAIEIIPNEDSYFLNIAHSYILMNQLDKAIEFLNKVENENLKSNTGKYEFLLASIFIKRGNLLKACEYVKASIRLGYKDGVKLNQLLNCVN